MLKFMVCPLVICIFPLISSSVELHLSNQKFNLCSSVPKLNSIPSLIEEEKTVLPEKKELVGETQEDPFLVQNQRVEPKKVVPMEEVKPVQIPEEHPWQFDNERQVWWKITKIETIGTINNPSYLGQMQNSPPNFSPVQTYRNLSIGVTVGGQRCYGGT